MLYINSLVFLLAAAIGNFANRIALIAALVAAYGWHTNTPWAVFVGIIVFGLMAITGAINAIMTVGAVILHTRTITAAEVAMVRAQRQGDGPAYEYARKDKSYAINSLVVHMSELATWPIVGLDPRIAVRSLREQIKDGCRIPVRW